MMLAKCLAVMFIVWVMYEWANCGPDEDLF